MKSIGIGDIQKNTSIFNNLTEAIEIIDKRKKKVVAVVYPVKKERIVHKLAGKYKDRILKSSSTDMKFIKEAAMTKAMEEKYGNTH
ncbi:conserved hypothetical protein [Bathymodiolus platifrons methanotrophic gill symbiont]|uniref:hypothetical protein n=1 Tax=Bathymodiolus platifrons methanotrophic gill symbiont TaxID=113268 RepID=UPI000B41AFAA|nr:hypothetical protein [Bathymodiolus platifrons methanotrophic gill symbiont]TXL12380.1 hypothetical protein BMR05_15550 [Methylococcaceae bacterium HT4]TXL12742.1 hypothetical protein BMR04_15055 [Methylococcaceae bacterium HT3]TXL16652.1 hypothetical protein BMR06_15600 [Methylococcaceae bacterium HT5]TXL19995.1 hypothetical protein BMR03_14750 [Methylococcaceae bacterium HT2]GAW87699.1 conserved hypothetical protein [Bathymodiolus platifrons methanotrophic gill symbiont]